MAGSVHADQLAPAVKDRLGVSVTHNIESELCSRNIVNIRLGKSEIIRILLDPEITPLSGVRASISTLLSFAAGQVQVRRSSSRSDRVLSRAQPRLRYS
jgi:hypothetical protein